MVRCGLDIQQVCSDAGAATIDYRGYKRHGNTRGGERDDGKRADFAVCDDRNLVERSAETACARVAAIKEPRPATVAFVGNKVRVFAKSEVADMRNGRAHRSSLTGVLMAEPTGRSSRLR